MTHAGGGTTRDFTTATFVVHEERVLMVRHRKLRLWLPPGGHIEPHELPDEAAVREVKEETGVDCVLVGETGLHVAYPRQLIRPEGVQVEDIASGHQHIDLIYFARLADPTPGLPTLSLSQECEDGGWYTLEQIDRLETPADVRAWARRAVERTR